MLYSRGAQTFSYQEPPNGATLDHRGSFAVQSLIVYLNPGHRFNSSCRDNAGLKTQV